MNFGLQPSGSDDTGAFMDAFAKLPRGGELGLDDGDFCISQEISVPKGVRIRGQGAAHDPANVSPTRVLWIGEANAKTMFSFVNVDGSGLRGVRLDGAVWSPLILYGCQNSDFADLSIVNFSGVGSYIVPSTDRNSDWNEFRHMTVMHGPDGLILDGNGEFNACHNRFHGLNVQECPGVSIGGGDADNNSFYEVMTGGGSVGLLIEDPVKFRDNRIFGAQLGGAKSVVVVKQPKPFTSQPTRIYGFSLENGESLDPAYAPYVKIL